MVFRHWGSPNSPFVRPSHLISSYRISSRQHRGGGATPAAGAPLERRPLIQDKAVIHLDVGPFVFYSLAPPALRDGAVYGIILLARGGSYDSTPTGTSIYIQYYVALVCERAQAGHYGKIGLVEREGKERKGKKRECVSRICRSMHKPVTHIVPMSIDGCFGWLIMPCHRRRVNIDMRAPRAEVADESFQKAKRRSIWMRQRRWQGPAWLGLAWPGRV